MPTEVSAALIGGIIGAILTFFGMLVKGRLDDNTERTRLAAALYCEAKALWDRYEQVAGQRIAEWRPGQNLPLLGVPLVESQNFFAVYDHATARLGMFAADDIEKIVRAYTLGKAHIETLNQAATLARTYAQALPSYYATTHPDLARERTTIEQLISSLGTQMQSESTQVRAAGAAAIAALARYLGVRGPRQADQAPPP